MTIDLTFHGAAGGVTGSCQEVRTERSRILVDLGQFQGGPAAELANRRPLPDPVGLDAVLVTHAHLDHVGRLPMLDLERFTGPILATDATIDLAGIILRDAANIQAERARRLARRRARRGRTPWADGAAVPPLFTVEDVERVLDRFEAVTLDAPVQVTEDMTATWFEAGHILGSASIRLDVVGAGGSDGPGGAARSSSRTIIFSGDIGQHGVPLLRNPSPADHADLVLLESTYGDRDHRPRTETVAELVAVLTEAVQRGSKVLIPSFAVGRTQSLLFHLRELFTSGTVAPVPVYVDSPMANRATAIYRDHPECFDEEARAILGRGEGPMHVPGLRMITDAAESRALNDSWDPAIIIAGSGMCTGGRILHHLKHTLWRRNAAVVFVGFQARGTLGRRLVDGERTVQVLGEPVAVRASIHTIGGMSAHAGRTELLQWASAIGSGRRRFILNHGEPPAAASLAAALEARGMDARPAVPGETITLT